MSDSLPPHLLRAPGSMPGTPPRGRQAVSPAASAPDSGQQETSAPLLLAGPGTPGTYEPAVAPPDRPRNVTDLRQRVQPATPEPWPAGAYVITGTSGKRAHWNGEDWKLGESPGYPAGELVSANRSETEQMTEARSGD